MSYIPYTYLIGWKDLDKWYYGVEYSTKRNANPSNLWTIYYSSSKNVKYHREHYGEPDVIQVRKIFNSGTVEERRKHSQIFERKVLQRLHVTTSKRWLNESICGNGNNKHPEWVRRKISKSLKGRVFSEEWKERLSEAKRGENHPNFGKSRNDETKRKSSLANRGQKRSEETKYKMSIKAKERSSKSIICPHCGKEGKGPTMQKWHFSNCRLK